MASYFKLLFDNQLTCPLLDARLVFSALLRYLESMHQPAAWYCKLLVMVSVTATSTYPCPPSNRWRISACATAQSEDRAELSFWPDLQALHQVSQAV
jgi:hypothetical protein